MITYYEKNKILALILSVLIPVYASDLKSNEKIAEENSQKSTELKENLKDGYTVEEGKLICWLELINILF